MLLFLPELSPFSTASRLLVFPFASFFPHRPTPAGADRAVRGPNRPVAHCRRPPAHDGAIHHHAGGCKWPQVHMHSVVGAEH